MTLKIFSFILPLLVTLSFTLISEYLFGKIKNFVIKSICMMICGLTGTAIIYWIIIYLCELNNMRSPKFGSPHSLLFGVLIGISISILSALLFFIKNKPKIGQLNVFVPLPNRILSNIFPAFIEETGFRGGLVHFLELTFGSVASIVVGGFTFGISHLLNQFFGKPFILKHIIAATMAGFMFSSAYLQYNLLFVIGMHWSWNSLCVCWVDLFNLDHIRGPQEFESAYSTIFITLLITIIFILFPETLTKR